jgi:hypothetical protein
MRDRVDLIRPIHYSQLFNVYNSDGITVIRTALPAGFYVATTSPKLEIKDLTYRTKRYIILSEHPPCLEQRLGRIRLRYDYLQSIVLNPS